MSKSSGGFSIGTIIFLVIAYNAIFDDDDKDAVEIVEQAKEIVIKTKEVIVESRDAKTPQEIIKKAKEKFTEDQGEEKSEEIVAEEETADRPPPQIISPEPEENDPTSNDEEFEKL